MAVAAADSGSEDLYTESDRVGRARASTVSLSLSESTQFKRQNLRNSQEMSMNRDSMESESSKGLGLLRMSLPNNGWGRRSMELFDSNENENDDFGYNDRRSYSNNHNDDDNDDYLYNNRDNVSRSRNRNRGGYDEDSRPMMASLTLLPNGEEKEREKEKEKEREKDRENERDGEKEKQRTKQKEKEKDNAKDSNKDNNKEAEKIKEIEKIKLKENEKEKEKEKEKVIEKEEQTKKDNINAMIIQSQFLDDNSLTSAVDMRNSHNSDLGSISGINENEIKKSKYKEFMESSDARKIVKKIPFDDDDDSEITKSIENFMGSKNKNILNDADKKKEIGKDQNKGNITEIDSSYNDNKIKIDLKNDKNVSTSALTNFMNKNNKNNINNINENKIDNINTNTKNNENNTNINNTNNIDHNDKSYIDVQPFDSDDDDDDDGSLNFNLSHGNSANLTGFVLGILRSNNICIFVFFLYTFISINLCIFLCIFS